MTDENISPRLRREIDRLLAESADMKADAAVRAEEVLDHVYRALIAMPPFTLRDGMQVELSVYIDPEKNTEGKMH